MKQLIELNESEVQAAVLSHLKEGSDSGIDKDCVRLHEGSLSFLPTDHWYLEAFRKIIEGRTETSGKVAVDWKISKDCRTDKTVVQLFMKDIEE